MVRTLSALVATLFSVHASYAADAPSPRSNCVVSYEAGEGTVAGLTENVQLLPHLPKTLPNGGRKDVVSMHATSRMTVYRSNTMHPGPWATIVAFNSNSGALSVLSVDNAMDVQAQWINEKLAFIRIWWGRIASSDMIFDTDQSTFIYRELANYSALSDDSCE